jgi:hypothetical protein
MKGVERSGPIEPFDLTLMDELYKNPCFLTFFKRYTYEILMKLGNRS